MADIQERLTQLLGDRYQVERELGKGGMATVFLAKDIKHERDVAIKVLHPELSASIGAERFEREIKLAAKLQHPHILGLYDSGEAGDLFYYVMPFVVGESLRDRLDREGQLPIEDAIQYALETADALGHAHKLGIIHRDIKPENILISGGHALVADFGIAKAASEGGGARLTQTGMAVGTPVYMAPEQSVGDAVGPTADLYSLGCMLYEMLAGEPPFTAKNPQALMARHAMEAVPSIRIIRNTVPPEVEETIFAAMAKVPADRPQNAAQFAELLGGSLGSTATMRATMRHTAARRIPTGTHQLLAARRGPLWTRPWVLAALGAVVVAGGGIGAWRLGVFGGGRPGPVVGGLDPHNVAVLYFEDRSSDKRLHFLADGLTEDLIGQLAQVQALHVVSKSGSARYRTGDLGMKNIADSLGVGTLLRGSVERQGDKIHVNVTLVDGNSGADFKSAGLDLPGSNLLTIRDSVAQEVTTLVRATLGEEIKLQSLREGTRNPTAWSLVQQASQLRKTAEAAAARSDTLARNQAFGACDSLLALAERQDAKWVDPVIARSVVAYRRSRLSGRDPYVIKQWVEVGLGHANRALAVDPKNPDALEVRGNLQYWSWLSGLEPDAGKAKALLAAAKNDLDQATGINKNQAGAWSTLSHLNNQIGSTTDVILAAQRALEADAFLENADVIMARLFLAYYDAGDFTNADHWCEVTGRRFKGDYTAPRCELFLQTTKARPKPDVALAWKLADSVTKLAPAPRRAWFELNSRLLVAGVLARAGLADSARRVVDRSKGDVEMNPTRDLALFGAFVYAQLGDRDRAIDMLKTYLAVNERLRAAFADQPGWWFRGIADDPKFKQLVGSTSQ